VKLAIGVAILGAAGTGTVAVAGDRSEFRAHLNGWAEVPVVITDGSGAFRARAAQDGEAVDWQLSYAGLSTPVQQAHIHVAQRRVNGRAMRAGVTYANIHTEQSPGGEIRGQVPRRNG
jgi:hypothetical protein